MVKAEKTSCHILTENNTTINVRSQLLIYLVTLVTKEPTTVFIRGSVAATENFWLLIKTS